MAGGARRFGTAAKNLWSGRAGRAIVPRDDRSCRRYATVAAHMACLWRPAGGGRGCLRAVRILPGRSAVLDAVGVFVAGVPGHRTVARMVLPRPRAGCTGRPARRVKNLLLR